MTTEEKRHEEMMAALQQGRSSPFQLPSSDFVKYLIAGVIAFFIWRGDMNVDNSELASSVALLNQRVERIDTTVNGIQATLATEFSELQSLSRGNERDVAGARDELARQREQMRALEQSVSAIRTNRFTEEDGFELERRVRSLEAVVGE